MISLSLCDGTHFLAGITGMDMPLATHTPEARGISNTSSDGYVLVLLAAYVAGGGYCPFVSIVHWYLIGGERWESDPTDNIWQRRYSLRHASTYDGNSLVYVVWLQ